MPSGSMDTNSKVVSSQDFMEDVERKMQALQATVESDEEEPTKRKEKGKEKELILGDMVESEDKVAGKGKGKDKGKDKEKMQNIIEPDESTPLQENSAPVSNAGTTSTSASGGPSTRRTAAAMSSLSLASSVSNAEATLAQVISDRVNRTLQPPTYSKCQKCDATEPKPGAYTKCSKCKTTAYCGGNCKKADRKDHKPNCARLAEAFNKEADKMLAELAEEHAIGGSANQHIQIEALRDTLSAFNKHPEDAMLLWIACFQLWVHDGFRGCTSADDTANPNCNDPTSHRVQQFRQFLHKLKKLDREWAPWLRKKGALDKCVALASDNEHLRFVGQPASPVELMSRFGCNDDELGGGLIHSLRQAAQLVCGNPLV